MSIGEILIWLHVLSLVPLECLSKGCATCRSCPPSRSCEAVNAMLGGFHVAWRPTGGISPARGLLGWLKTRSCFHIYLVILGTRWHSGLEVLNFIVVFSRGRIENPVWIGKSA